MHLVNWDILKRPTLEGGLQIRDPELANLALGGKLIWQLYSNKNHLVSMIFWRKYLKGGSLRNLNLLTSLQALQFGICTEEELINFNIIFIECLEMGKGSYYGMIKS